MGTGEVAGMSPRPGWWQPKRDYQSTAFRRHPRQFLRHSTEGDRASRGRPA